MTTMSPQLTQILTNLANNLGGTSNPAYINILHAINSSPDLFNQLNDAASSNPPSFTAITYGNGVGGDMAGTTMVLNANSFSDTDPTVLNNDFIAVMGHEIEHAEDASTVLNDETLLYNDGTLSGGPSQSVTEHWIEQYAGIGLKDEGSADIQDWNDIVNANAISSSPLSLNDLITADPYSYEIFTQQSDGSYTARPGISINGDNTITVGDGSALAYANVNGATAAVSLFSPSTVPGNIGDYDDFYFSEAINAAGALEGGNLNISYSDLGLIYPSSETNLTGALNNGGNAFTSLQISQFLATGIFSQPVTITDTDDGTVSTFTAVNNSNGASTLLHYSSPLEVDNFDIASNGTAYYSDKSTTDPEGNNPAVDITGTGDTVSVDYAKVTLEPGTQATVLGDGDNFFLTNNSMSELDVSGIGETINSNQNTIHLLSTGSVATIVGSENTIEMKGNNQTLTAAQAYGSTVTAASGSMGETINGSGLTVNAGTGSQFALNGMSFTFNGGTNTQLNIAGGFNIATLGDGSQVTLSAPTTTGGFVGLNTINESNGTIIVAFNDSTYGADTLNGSGNTITSASGAFDINGNNNVFTGSGPGSYFGITGDNNTFSNSSGGGIFLLRGSNNTVSSGNGGTFEIYSGTGNTLTASGATVELVAMGTTTINGSNDTFDLDSTGDDTLNVSGSGNTIDAVEGGQLNLLSGSNFDVYIENGTINVGANVSAILELDDDQITASNGDSFQIVNGNNTFTAAAGSTVAFSDEEQDLLGDSITIAQGAVVLGDKTEFTINGDTNAISGGNQDVIILKGSDDLVSGTNDAITFNGPLDGGDNSLSISGTGNKLTATNAAIAFIDGQAGDSLQITGVGDTISAADKSIDFYTNAGNATVIGAGDTLSGSEQTLTLSGASMTDATVLSLTSSTISAGVGNFVISGYGNTFTGIAGSQLNVTNSGNIVNLSNATITVADNTSLTIVGSNDQINGGDSDGLTIMGTDDVVTATNSSIVFGQNNAGDTVTGAGDGGSNWSAPDGDLPPGDNGGYSPPQTSNVAQHLSSHSEYAMGAEAISTGDGRVGAPDIHSLVHAMAAFHAEGNGMAMDSLLTTSSPTEHLHLAAAA